MNTFPIQRKKNIVPGNITEVIPALFRGFGLCAVIASLKKADERKQAISGYRDIHLLHRKGLLPEIRPLMKAQTEYLNVPDEYLHDPDIKKRPQSLTSGVYNITQLSGHTKIRVFRKKRGYFPARRFWVTPVPWREEAGRAEVRFGAPAPGRA